MRADIAEMEHMLDEYLAFARGEGGEESAAHRPGRAGARRRGRGRQGAPARAASPSTRPTHVTVSVKRAGLRRVLSNLLDNALKHGAKVAVSLARDERMVEIAVEDNGPGIPEARREEAFRPFHRLDEGRNLQSGGSGLGLAIARDIARAHGGDLVLG